MSISDERLQRVTAALDALPAEAKILDVGGGMRPLAAATHVVDYLPYQPPQRVHGSLDEVAFSGETWFQLDITRERLPFEDNYFDFVFCSHTLEDVYNPFLCLEEIQRVGKRGYIETPSPEWEMTKGIQMKNICGAQHHKWLVSFENDRLTFFEKSGAIYQSPFYHFSRRQYEKLGFSDATAFFWEGGFEIEHISNFSTRDTMTRIRNKVLMHKPLLRAIWTNDRARNLALKLTQ